MTTQTFVAEEQVQVGDIGERERQFKEATGRDHLTRVSLDFSQMMNEGLLVDINAHNLGIFKRTASWEQLGIRPEDARRARLGKGHQKLAPSKIVNKLASFETRIRSNLDNYSFQIRAFGDWRWLPLTAYDEWRERHDELTAELQAFIQSEILDKWDEIEAANREYFEASAERAWKAWQATRQEEGYDEAVVIIKGRGVYKSKEDFVASVVSEGMRSAPSREEVEEMNISYETGYIFLPPEITQMYARAKREEAEAVAAEADAIARRRREREALSQVEARKEAIRQAEMERARQQLAEIGSPFDEVTQKLRARIHEDVVSIAEHIEKYGYMRGRVGSKAEGLYHLYKILGGATNDVELEEALKQLDRALAAESPDGTARHTARIKDALDEIAGVTSKASAELHKMFDANQTTAASFIE